MNPVEKIIDILEKNGYERKETSGISMGKGIHYIYEKSNGTEISGRELVNRVYIRTGDHAIEFESTPLRYVGTLISFGPSAFQVSVGRAFFLIKECYNKNGDMVDLKWNYVSFDHNYDGLLWEMDRALYKLYNEGE